MEKKQTFFDFAAQMGITKHIGGVEATEALIELCHIGKGKRVLDVGCGVGALQLRRETQFAPHRLALTILWPLTTIVFVAMLALGVRDMGQFRIERYVLNIAYTAALLWYLGRTGPSLNQLPDIHPLLLQGRRIGRLVPGLVIAALLLVSFSDAGPFILDCLLMIATLWVLVVWGREIRLRPAVLGLTVAVIALLGGLPFWDNSFVVKPFFVMFSVFVPPMFIAGGMLLKRTGLGGSQLHAGQYIEARIEALVTGVPTIAGSAPGWAGACY